MKRNEEYFIDFKVVDASNKKLDEGFMSVDKAMAMLKRMMKRKFQ